MFGVPQYSESLVLVVWYVIPFCLYLRFYYGRTRHKVLGIVLLFSLGWIGLGIMYLLEKGARQAREK